MCEHNKKMFQTNLCAAPALFFLINEVYDSETNHFKTPKRNVSKNFHPHINTYLPYA